MNNEVKLRDHEESFEVKPVGIKYICEFCNKGEMIVDVSYNGDVPNNMYPHYCTECRKKLFLPRMYPYIKWVKNEERKIDTTDDGK